MSVNNETIKTNFFNLRDEIMCAIGFVDGIGEDINKDLLCDLRTEILITVCDLFNNLSKRYDEKEEVAKEIDNTKRKIEKLVDTAIKSITE